MGDPKLNVTLDHAREFMRSPQMDRLTAESFDIYIGRMPGLTAELRDWAMANRDVLLAAARQAQTHFSQEIRYSHMGDPREEGAVAARTHLTEERISVNPALRDQPGLQWKLENTTYHEGLHVAIHSWDVILGLPHWVEWQHEVIRNSGLSYEDRAGQVHELGEPSLSREVGAVPKRTEEPDDETPFDANITDPAGHAAHVDEPTLESSASSEATAEVDPAPNFNSLEGPKFHVGPDGVPAPDEPTLPDFSSDAPAPHESAAAEGTSSPPDANMSDAKGYAVHEENVWATPDEPVTSHDEPNMSMPETTSIQSPDGLPWTPAYSFPPAHDEPAIESAVTRPPVEVEHSAPPPDTSHDGVTS